MHILILHICKAYSDISNPNKIKKTRKTKRDSQGEHLRDGKKRSGNSPLPETYVLLNNRSSMKHECYAHWLLNLDAISDDAAALTLEDEFLHIRAMSLKAGGWRLEAGECIRHRKTQLADAANGEGKY